MITNNVVWATSKGSDQSLIRTFASMTLRLLIKCHLEFLSLKGGSTGSSESTVVKMPHCWKSHGSPYFKKLTPVTPQLYNRPTSIKSSSMEKSIGWTTKGYDGVCVSILPTTFFLGYKTADYVYIQRKFTYLMMLLKHFRNAISKIGVRISTPDRNSFCLNVFKFL